MPVPGLYWADAARIGPVQARYWQLMACLQGNDNLTIYSSGSTVLFRYLPGSTAFLLCCFFLKRKMASPRMMKYRSTPTTTPMMMPVIAELSSVEAKNTTINSISFTYFCYKITKNNLISSLDTRKCVA